MWNAILQVIFQLAALRIRDYLPPEYLVTGGSHLTDFLSRSDAGCVTSTLVRSILLRASYGGMAGDVQMLRGFAKLWAHRLKFKGGGAADDGERRVCV